MLWPEFRIGYRPNDNKEQVNPRRNRENKLKIGDIPLEIGGISIGKIEFAVPWMNPAAWQGVGLNIG